MFNGLSFRDAHPGWWRAPATWLVFALLLLSYSLPNVIALRKVLTVTALLLVMPEFLSFFRNPSRNVKRSLLFFALLLCWTLVVAVFIADDPLSSLEEWKGEWLPAGLVFLAGVGAFATLENSASRKNDLWIFAMLLVPLTILIAVHLVWVAAEYLRVGSISPHFSSFSDHKANVTYAACTLLPVVFGFAIARSAGIEVAHRQFLSFVWLAGILAVAAVVTSGARNGVIVMFLGVVAAAFVALSRLNVMRRPGKSRVLIVALLAMVVFAVGWAGVKWDPRWQRFVQTIPVALDTKTHQEWLDPPGSTLPVTSDGGPAEESAYQRIAWARVGAGMLLEHPWGLEISRNTFHDLVVERYGRGSMAHAHNSMIDFGLNAGFLGLALWLVFVGSLLVTGWRATRSRAAIAGWALIFLVLMYLARSMLDSIMRDHILEQFMLTAGVLLGTIACTRTEPANG